MLGFDKIMDACTAEAEAAFRRDSVLVRYKPSGVRSTRLIKVVKAAAVVMHSPPRQPTVEDLRNWRVPPCVPGWNNQNGYAIPLDKRHSAVGWEVEINHRGMAELSEALNAAAEVCREGVALRCKIRREREMREKERRDEELREVARRARDEFGGKRSRAKGGEGTTKREKKRRSGGIADPVSVSGGLAASGRGELLFDRSLVDAYCHGGGDEDEVKTMMMKKAIEFDREEDADPFGLDGFLSNLV